MGYPFQDKQAILLLMARKMFCDNPECTIKTFSERFNFVNQKAKKTNRLIEKILVTSTKLSSVSASSLLKMGSVKVWKSSICDLLKKMPAIVNKLSVVRVLWMILLSGNDRLMVWLWWIWIPIGELSLLILAKQKEWRNGLNLTPFRDYLT